MAWRACVLYSSPVILRFAVLLSHKLMGDHNRTFLPTCLPSSSSSFSSIHSLSNTSLTLILPPSPHNNKCSSLFFPSAGTWCPPSRTSPWMTLQNTPSYLCIQPRLLVAPPRPSVPRSQPHAQGGSHVCLWDGRRRERGGDVVSACGVEAWGG